MSRELQPLVPISLVKIELPTVIKNEPPEYEIVEIGINDILNLSESEEEIIPDVKGIDIVYHPLCKKSIKSEILESKHCESVETRVLVKAEDSPFIKTENTTRRIKTEDTSDENGTKGTGQAVVEIKASNEHSNALSNLETDGQSVFNFSKNLNGISVRSRKSKRPKETDFAECYKTDNTTLWEKEKIKVIKAPEIPVEAHEYTSLANDKHVCNYCQQTYKKLKYLKLHIKRMHREVTTMYQCPYCPYQLKSKWKREEHIIRKHKNTKDIQWFQCHLCEKKMKLKSDLTKHKKVHLTQEQMQDGLYVKRYHCNKCSYKTDRNSDLKNHKIIHLKPEEIEYFYCYHCSHKSKHKQDLKKHIFGQHFKNSKEGKRYGCNKCDYETYVSTSFKDHKLNHLNPEEIQYFYCYHCSHKAKRKPDLKKHIFRHFKNGQVRFDCYICNFMTSKRESIIKHIKNHSKVRNKSEINERS